MRAWALLSVLAAVSLQGAAERLGPVSGQERPLQVSADYTVRVRASAKGRATFEAAAAGPASLLVLGLRRGGLVRILVNGSEPASLELLARGGLAAGRADSALLRTMVQAGRNDVEVVETDGVQVVRVPGSNRWFATATQFPGTPVFSIDLDALLLPYKYAVKVRHGGKDEGFLWFSGCWDRYYGEVYADRVSRVQGHSGAASAALHYTLEYPQLHLVMPTQLTLVPEPLTGAFSIRVRQVMRSLGPAFPCDNVEFLHVKVTDDGAWDWRDGQPDYVWYRSQTGDCPDAAPGSHTGMVRIDDDTLRTFSYRSSTRDPLLTAQSDRHHTAAGVPLGAVNTIGGFFTKTGVGSCGWVFHQYRASWRPDLTPIFSHCGDGADTHFYVAVGQLYGPLELKSGDKLEVEYSLWMLSSEVSREQIEDLNEADLYLFGTEQEQQAPVTQWIGTKQAVGLVRADGSLILLGIGREPAQVPLPGATRAQIVRAFRLLDLGQPTVENLDVSLGTVGVVPGWITVVDCGAALFEPVVMVAGAPYTPPMPAPEEPAETAADEESPWPAPRLPGEDGFILEIRRK